MPSELDHVFICTACGANAEADSLAAFGLTEGAPNVHPGQGTACRRFFFHNAYLELLWVENSDEAQSGPARPMRLWERWTGRTDQACPFGLGFRPKANEAESPPFAAWLYRPAYLAESQNIPVATNSEVVSEPFLFYMPFVQRPDRRSYLNRRQPVEHPAGFREVSRVEVILPNVLRISPELQSVREPRLVEISEGAKHLLILCFDGESQRKEADFRPVLPLVFRW